jgi:hypothetical protein
MASDVRVEYGKDQCWDGLQKVFAVATNALLGISGLVKFGVAARHELFTRLAADVVAEHGDRQFHLDEVAVLTDEVIHEWSSGLPELFAGYDPTGNNPDILSSLMLLVGDPAAEPRKRLGAGDLTNCRLCVWIPKLVGDLRPATWRAG